MFISMEELKEIENQFYAGEITHDHFITRLRHFICDCDDKEALKGAYDMWLKAGDKIVSKSEDGKSV